VSGEPHGHEQQIVAWVIDVEVPRCGEPLTWRPGNDYVRSLRILKRPPPSEIDARRVVGSEVLLIGCDRERVAVECADAVEPGRVKAEIKASAARKEA
jgi:hypothetical protein